MLRLHGNRAANGWGPIGMAARIAGRPVEEITEPSMDQECVVQPAIGPPGFRERRYPSALSVQPVTLEGERRCPGGNRLEELRAVPRRNEEHFPWRVEDFDAIERERGRRERI